MRMAFSILSIAPTIPHPQTVLRWRFSCGNAVSELCERSAQSILDDLAGGIRGQLVEELYIARDLVTAIRSRLHPINSSAVGASAAERSTTNALPTWPSRSSGTPMTAACAIAGCSARNPSISAGIGVEAADDEHVLLPADDAQPARLGELTEVAGVQPTVGIDRLGRRGRVVEVALHDAVTTDEHLAVLGDAHLDVSHGTPAVVATSVNESPGRDSVTLPDSVSP